MFGVARGLAGGLFGATYPAALIYLGDTVRADVRQRAVTRLMVGVALGTALASVGAGIIADVSSWRVMFVLTGLAAVVLAVRLSALPEPQREHHGGTFLRPIGYVARSPITLFVLLCALAEGAVLLGTITLLPPAMEHAGASTTVAGIATGVYGASVFAFSTLVGRISGHWRASRFPIACRKRSWKNHEGAWRWRTGTKISPARAIKLQMSSIVSRVVQPRPQPSIWRGCAG